MAAPVVALYKGFSFRDSKGQTSRMRVLIGDATVAAVGTDEANFTTHLGGVSNCNVWFTESNNPGHTYGTSAEYETVEDKMSLTFTDPSGFLHRYQVPAPKTAGFLADGETVDSAQTQVALLITDFTTFIYGRFNDTAPLVYVGGTRLRKKIKRKFTIWTKNPALAGPGL